MFDRRTHKHRGRLLIFLIFVAVCLCVFFVFKFFSEKKVASNYRNNFSSISKTCENNSAALFNIEELNIEGLKNKNIILNIYDIRDFSYINSLSMVEKLENSYRNRFAVIDIILDEDVVFNRDVIINYIIKNDIKRPVIKMSYDELIGNFYFEGSKSFVLINSTGVVKDVIFGDRLNEEKVFDSVEKNLLSQMSAPCVIENIKLEREKNPEYFVKSLNKIRYVNKSGSSYFVVSDSEARKIYMISLKGEIISEIGNGKKGMADGFGDMVSFCYPFGLSIRNNKYLYVADTCNNAIRMIDLDSKDVSTILENDKLLKNPVDLEILDNNLFIMGFDSKDLIKYDINEKKLSFVECDECGDRSMKLVKYGQKLYFINEKKNSIFSIDKNNEIETVVNFGDMESAGKKVKIKDSNNFYIDETGIYVVDKFDKKLFHVKNNTLSIMDISKYPNLPNDIIGVRDKVYVTNENDILEIDKNTKNIKKIPLSFSYTYKSNNIYDEFLNVNNLQSVEIGVDNENNMIKINLDSAYFLDRKAPQNIAIFFEDRQNNQAILIKEYSLEEIFNGNLKLPELQERNTYYILAKLSYKNRESDSSYMVNKYKRKIIASKKSLNNELVIDFLY